MFGQGGELMDVMAIAADGLAMTLAGSDQAFTCTKGQSLLTAMIAARRTVIKVGCRNGGCGVCRVRVLSGSYLSEKMTRSRISEADEAQRIVLACRILPGSDLTFEPLPLNAAASGV